MTRKNVLEVQKMVTGLFKYVSEAIEHVINIHIFNEIRDDFKCILNFCNDPFQDIKSEYRLFKVLKV